MQIFGGFNKSIGTKILACILLTLIVILGVRLWIINKYQTEMLKTEAKNTSRLFSNGIAHLVQKAIQPDNNAPVDKEMLELFVKDLSSPAEIESLFVVDSRGTVLFSK
ncbi:MAG: hypothetical protein WC486_05895, partial [Candidatus Omnitrophota bacterium]